MRIAQVERTQLCELLLRTAPTAPTLCAGWDAHDLACHLWIRESDPVGAPGILVGPLAGVTASRMAALRDRWSYRDLVERIRTGPPRFSPLALGAVDEQANALEYFVHHEDVRRAGDHPAAPRALDREVEEWFWSRLTRMGRVMYRRSGVGVVLEWPGSGQEHLRVRPGDRTVTLQGMPSELVLHAYGRGAVAEVTAVGEPEAVRLLQGSEIGL